jgi:hypothetical protein
MATLAGSVAQGGAADFIGSGDVFATRYQAVASGTVDQVQVAVRSGSTFTSLNFAVYSDSASVPNVVLPSTVTAAVTSNTAGTKTGAWASGPAIVSGTFYWLAIWAVGGGWNFTGNAGVSGYRGKNAAAFTSPWNTTGDTIDTTSGLGLPILVEQVASGTAATTGFIPTRMPLGV